MSKYKVETINPCAEIFMDSGTGFMRVDKHTQYMRKYNPAELKTKVPSMSKTKLKQMLYSLINKRDKLEKKNIGAKVEVVDKSMMWSFGQADDTADIKNIKDAILIITDEIAHREFAKLCPDTNDPGKE